MQKNIDAVQAIYAAFGRGDIPEILEALADDVAWESWRHNFAQEAGVPWMKALKGRRAVGEFFRVISEFNFTKFNVLSVLAGGDQVAAEVEVAAEVPTTGGSFAEEEMHLWTFNDRGQVTRFRHYLDTAKHMAVAKGQKTDK